MLPRPEEQFLVSSEVEKELSPSTFSVGMQLIRTDFREVPGDLAKFMAGQSGRPAKWVLH